MTRRQLAALEEAETFHLETAAKCIFRCVVLGSWEMPWSSLEKKKSRITH